MSKLLQNVCEFQLYSAKLAVTGIITGALLSPLFTTLPTNAISRFSEYSTPTAGVPANKFAPGPDGAMWFSKSSGDNLKRIIGRIDMTGNVTEYPIPGASAYPSAIAAGPDGAMWFTEEPWGASQGDRIGRITMSGTFTHSPRFASTTIPSSIVAGPDGAMWFGEQFTNRIGRIAMDGTVSEYTTPNPYLRFIQSITLGPDNKIWFTHQPKSGYSSGVGNISPSTLTFTQQIATDFEYNGDIVTGKDGGLWHLKGYNQVYSIVRRDTQNNVTAEYTLPSSFKDIGNLTVGPDGKIWFSTSNHSFSYVTTTGVIGPEYNFPKADLATNGMAFGPDGAIWFSQAYPYDKIGRFDPTPPPAAPTNLTATTPTSQNPVLSWGSVAGATSYNVYRGNTKIATVSTTSYTDTTAPEANITYFVTANGPYDEHGESARSNEIHVTIDRTNPTILYSASPTANTNGWNNTNVTVAFTCSDAASGIASCTSPVTLSNEGSNQTVTGAATDNAGNSQSLTTSAFNIDKTVPTAGAISLSGNGYINVPGFPPFIPPARFVTNGSVTITTPASDSLSGIWNGEYFIDTDPGNGNGQPMTFSGNSLSSALATSSVSSGNHTLYVRSKDMASNWSAPSSFTFTKL